MLLKNTVFGYSDGMKILENSNSLSWEPPKSALEKWDRKICAAKHTKKDRQKNSINILGTIGEDFFGEGTTAQGITDALELMGSDADVTININSPGGSMFEGLAIYNILRQHEGNVNVKVLGLAASAASVIAMAGDDIQIAESGFFMIHNAWAVVIGNKDDLTEASGLMAKFDNSMAGIYAANTELSKADAKAAMTAETWYSGEDAVDSGLANSLLPSDAVDGDGDAPQSSLTRIDTALAKEGVSRTERRAMIKELTTSTPSATDDIKPSADATLCKSLEELLNTFKSTKKETI